MKIIFHSKTRHFIFLFFFSVYLITVSGTIQSSDGLSMFLLTQNIAENRSISIDTDQIGLVVKSGKNGKYYSKFGLAQSILVIPLFIIGKLISSFLNIPSEFSTRFTVSLYNPLVSAATCLIIYLISIKLKHEPKTALIVSLIYGYSTIAWHYSQTFMSEPATTLFMLCSVYFVIQYNKYSKTNILLAGSFMGLAVLTRTASVIAIPCILFYIFLIRNNKPNDRENNYFLKDIIHFMFPLIITAVILFYYNYIRFGDIFETGYAGENFSTNIFLGIYGLLFSTGKGLFVYNPLLILSVLGFYYFLKEKKNEAVLFLLLILSHIILYSLWHSWFAGMSWGGRFLLVVIPYLVIALKYVIESKKRFLTMGLIVLTVAGILIQFSSLFFSTSRQYYDLRSRYPDSYMNKLNYSPKYFPVIYQWKNIPKILQNVLDKDYVDDLINQAVKRRKFTNSDDNQILKNALAINVPNFWWIYAWFYGIPKWLILSSLIFLVATVFISGKKIFFSHELR